MHRRLLVWLFMVIAMIAPVHAHGQSFRDDFDGTSIDTEKWGVELVDGGIVVSDGRAIFTGGMNSFPVMTTRINPFPPGDFRVVVGMPSGSCAPRATQVFFGHPHPISCAPWTSFAVDFIQISPIGATPVHRTGWGRLKTIYR
jgi:hypothetical protein